MMTYSQQSYNHFVEVRARAFRNLANLATIGTGALVGITGEVYFFCTLTSNPTLLMFWALFWILLVCLGIWLVRFILLQLADISYANHGILLLRNPNTRPLPRVQEEV